MSAARSTTRTPIQPRRHQNPRRPVTESATSQPAGSSWRFVAGIFALALVIRIAHVLQLTGAPFFDHLLGDAHAYDQWARQVAAGDWLGSGVFYQAPLYPYLLGAFYASFGRDLLAVRVVQAGVGALSCGLLSLAALK